MIQKGELRIGNWVMEDVLGWTKISEICANHVEVEGLHMKVDRSVETVRYSLAYSSIAAIPLSPEILIACGFEKTDHVHPLLVYSDYRLGTCVLSIIESGVEVEFCGLDIEERTYITKVNYLHQLQNLYWCLCGKELIYKP